MANTAITNIENTPKVNAGTIIQEGSQSLATEIYNTVMNVGQTVALPLIAVAVVGLLWQSKNGQNDKVMQIFKWVLGICIGLVVLKNLPGVISWIYGMYNKGK